MMIPSRMEVVSVICCSLNEADRYGAMGAGFVEALRFLREPERVKDFGGGGRLIDLPIGRFQLAGDDLYVSVEEPETRALSSALFESHRQYVDVQMTLAGEELMAWWPIARLTPAGPWDESADIRFYEPRVTAPLVDASDGRLVVFFPEDGHAPLIAPRSPGRVKKLVIKIHRRLFDI